MITHRDVCCVQILVSFKNSSLGLSILPTIECAFDYSNISSGLLDPSLSYVSHLVTSHLPPGTVSVWTHAALKRQRASVAAYCRIPASVHHLNALECRIMVDILSVLCNCVMLAYLSFFSVHCHPSSE